MGHKEKLQSCSCGSWGAVWRLQRDYGWVLVKRNQGAPDFTQVGLQVPGGSCWPVPPGLCMKGPSLDKRDFHNLHARKSNPCQKGALPWFVKNLGTPAWFDKNLPLKPGLSKTFPSTSWNHSLGLPKTKLDCKGAGLTKTTCLWCVTGLSKAFLYSQVDCNAAVPVFLNVPCQKGPATAGKVCQKPFFFSVQKPAEKQDSCHSGF